MVTSMLGFIMNKSNGFVMGIENDNREKGSQIVTWSTDYNWDKQWKLTADGFIENVSTGLVLGIDENKSDKGGKIVTWLKDANWDKKWEMDAEGYIINKQTGLVMGIDDNGDGVGHKIITWTKDANWDKKWKFEPLVGHASLKLTQLFRCDGGSSGHHKVKVLRGSKTHISNSSELCASVKTSIGGAVKVFTASIDSSLESTISNSVSTEDFTEVEEEIMVNLDKPCYVYQVEVSMQAAVETIVVKGSKIISSTPIG